jgi:hypothetical protein
VGTDIHPFVEVRRDGKWHLLQSHVFPDLSYDRDGEDVWYHTNIPFNGMRSYALFGFLADVRNYSESPVIATMRGLPPDVSDDLREEHDGWNYHSASYLTLKEMADFNYDQIFWDRRVTKFNGRYWDGTARAEEGEGEHLTLHEFLPNRYFDDLEIMANLGYAPEDVRLVFWFDS